MASEELVTTEGDRLQAILDALEECVRKTTRYFTGSCIFYLVLIGVFLGASLTATETKARGADIGILILVTLGWLGMWISPLRGLKGIKVTLGGFFNLFYPPLKDQLEELKDASRWSDRAERLRRAEAVLQHQAEAEEEMRALPNRILSLVVITVIDLLIWLVWKNGVMALINQGIGMIVSQVHITLAPTTAIKALGK
jgi:hypothetical protein